MSSQTVIQNTENEPFLLPIDVGQYGEFEPDELEIRVCNAFIEVSGNQSWRMCDGGANRRSFSQRYVLPNYIDLKAIYCRLLDSKTVLISAPSLSIVSKLTSSIQLKVDYILGLDSKGLQYLKRYNTNSTQNKSSLKIRNKERESRSKAVIKENLTGMLIDLINGKPNSNLRLHQNGTVKRNVKFAINTKSKELDGKIHLDINQLMKERQEELSRSKKKIKLTNKSNNEQSSSQKSKKPRRKNKKRNNDSSKNEESNKNDKENRNEEENKDENGKKENKLKNTEKNDSIAETDKSKSEKRNEFNDLKNEKKSSSHNSPTKANNFFESFDFKDLLGESDESDGSNEVTSSSALKEDKSNDQIKSDGSSNDFLNAQNSKDSSKSTGGLKSILNFFNLSSTNENDLEKTKQKNEEPKNVVAKSDL